jgi:hypothetical protein
VEPTKSRTLRCAIYTRKSPEEGLEQDFNSLHAQREACDSARQKPIRVANLSRYLADRRRNSRWGRSSGLRLALNAVDRQVKSFEETGPIRKRVNKTTRMS